MLNQLLGGRYRVVQDLGEGGLAKTYIVEDHHRPGHPKCAVKFLKPASNDPDLLPTARRLFNKEAEILEKLGQHDQIPRLLAYFEENQEFYLVQEFIEGHTLSTEMPLVQRWPESKVVQMLQDVLPTLEFVHSYGVIHRDIKPNNLIRRQKDGRLVLIDFGAVKQVREPWIATHGSFTQNTIAIGTQGYMPTEQVRGKPRFNSDIYALGMIGIQAFTGLHPLFLQEDGDGEVIWRDRAEVSDKLAAILTKMVRYHFKDRYQSATEVLHALHPLANHYTLIQPTSVARQPTSEVAPEPELRETEVSLGGSPSNPKAVPEGELGETKVALDLKQPTSEVAPEPELRETEVSLGSSSSNPKAVPEGELGKTKVALDLKQPTSEVAPEPELGETEVSLGSFSSNPKAVPEEKLGKTKVALDLKQPTSEVAPEPKLWGTKVSKDTDPWHPWNRSAVPEEELWETKVALNIKQPTSKQLTSEVAPDEEEKVSGIFPAGSLAPPKDLELSPAPILAPFNKSRLLIGAGIASVLVSIFAGYTHTTHKQSYLQAQEALGQIEALKAAEKYQECVQQAETFPKDYSGLQAEVETLLHECQQGQAEGQLTKARKLAEQSRLKDAIALAAQVPAETNVHPQAQQLMSQWSEKIFQIASNKYQEGNLQEAIAIAGAVPADSPLAKKVQGTTQQWNEEWKQNQTHLEAAQKALDERRWQDAINTAKKVSNTAYWQKQSELIIQKAEAAIAVAQTANSRGTYKPRSRPVSRSSSNSSPRSRSVRRSSSNSPRSRPVPPSLSNSPRSRPVPRSISISPDSKSVPSSSSTSSGSRSTSRSRSTDWICLNNPNPKCHR
ncbi:MAG: protein kinase [Xenococcaceae cyanobacterium MO_234.B1]|nr:protein kinase [Xenococcaceae cyanobacterium MO_234.B1]